ncbi:MAG TPA: hypothetical protein VFG30_05345 [Polyangiales bacterium]|nr:hypothetical protein [Polyangiales bacterium]
MFAGSFDAYSWQTVSRKVQSIARVLRGRLDVREIKDVGMPRCPHNEGKALALDN